MNNKFALLFDFDQCQVLVTKTYDDEQEMHLMVVTTEIDGIDLSIKYSFKDVEKRNTAFDAFTREQAEKFLESSKEMLA